MNVLGGKPLSGAEFFSAGRFSEALNEYDVDNPLHQGEGGQAPVSPSQAVYAACNRAAAKLELEMCRSCLRDCDEAIRLDPYCLRAHVLKGIYVLFLACTVQPKGLVRVLCSWKCKVVDEPGRNT